MTCLSSSTFHRIVALVLCSATNATVNPASARDAEPGGWSWIEAEDYVQTNFAEHWERSSMGKPALVSGGEWLMKGVAADEVASLVPDEGVALKYAVSTPKPGTYRLWARVGWFRSRADFRWRWATDPGTTSPTTREPRI